MSILHHSVFYNSTLMTCKRDIVGSALTNSTASNDQ